MRQHRGRLRIQRTLARRRRTPLTRAKELTTVARELSPGEREELAEAMEMSAAAARRAEQRLLAEGDTAMADQVGTTALRVENAIADLQNND
jgi:hypothetical protein